MVFEKLINNYFKALTPAEVFKNIVCHDDLKEIMARSVFTENRTKTLLLGGPGTAKTLFASEICKKMKNWHFFDVLVLVVKALLIGCMSIKMLKE